MKVYDIFSKKMYRGTCFDDLRDGYITISNIEREVIAKVPRQYAKLIFNENEIPYMEEVK